MSHFTYFSTENWRRPKKEINFLFKLIKNYFNVELDNVIKNGIKIKIIGEVKNLPKSLKNNFKNTEKKTRYNKKITVNLALNYGAKKEILNALKKSNKKITEKEICKNLYTKNMPDPDILIRTGGRKRLSNFMLWQLAYTELYFLDKLWPDFSSKDLEKNHKKLSSYKKKLWGNLIEFRIEKEIYNRNIINFDYINNVYIQNILLICCLNYFRFIFH